MKLSTPIVFSILIFLLLLFAAGSLFFGGSSGINLSGNDFIFWQIRLPKTITAVLAGCTLSLAGLILQVIFRNPLAGPYVLGVSSGASLMVAITILTGQFLGLQSLISSGKMFVVIAAIGGGLLATMLVLLVAKKVQSNVVLLLIGLMIAQICGALQMSLEYFADPNNLKGFVIWGMGSLSNTTLPDLYIYAPLAAVVCIAILFYIKPLTAFLLGPAYAQNLGIDYKRKRFALIFISSVLTGLTTAYCGPIAFVGIAVPIFSRSLFKTANQLVHVFACALIGSIILLFADTISANILENAALPVNMITTLIGAPVVIFFMFRNKQW